ncbi:MAG: DUF3127 domain-containing protein [Bacteroidales bacterium]|jgi:hypothetical protein|nr:DUF3127 domain-containing protein [Bacteroidales bacterium]MDD3665031.1 DUF3127 domain-containing protein [Bacteroidales bacterium]
MDLSIRGKFVKALPEVSGEGRNGRWVKQNFIIETLDQYPKKICLIAWGDKTAAVKALNEGDEVKAQISIESREYNERWYTDVRAWEIERLSAGAALPNAASQPEQRPEAPVWSQNIDNNENAATDDLPF